MDTSDSFRALPTGMSISGDAVFLATGCVMKVRQFESGDVAAIWQLHNLAMDHVGANLGPGPWNDDLNAIPQLYREFLVGIIDDEIIAMGGLREADSETVEIKRMRVLPEYQRKGFGQNIFNRLLQSARTHRYKWIILDTLLKQENAIRFYTRNGFIEYGKSEFRGEPQLLFRRQL